MVAINNQAKQTRLGKYFPTSSFSWQWLAAGYCHLELSLGLLDSRGGIIILRFGSSGDGGDSSGDKTGEGSDHRGVVDHMLGHVVGHVLLDGDLGHELDGVVDVVSDVLDNGGGPLGLGRGHREREQAGLGVRLMRIGRHPRYCCALIGRQIHVR